MNPATRPTVQRVRAIQLILAFFCASCAGTDRGDAPGEPLDRVPDRVVEPFNRGVAHMERYDPVAAVKAFDEVVERAPEWTTARLNLGIALINTQQADDQVRAERELRRVIAEAPEEPRGYFTLGMLLRHLSRDEEARAMFLQVLRIDAHDGDAHYQLGALLMETEPEAARVHFESTLKSLPHHESACYRLQNLLRRAGERERAREVLARFQALKQSGAGVVTGMRYGEMGRYADIVRAFDAAPRSIPSGAPPMFREVADALGLGAEGGGRPGWPGRAGPDGQLDAGSFGPGVALADLDGDGDFDAFIPGGPGFPLYRNEGGRFRQDRSSGLDGSGAVAGFFGDYDGDGDPDLFLTCAGPNRLYNNQGDGTFGDVTSSAGVAGGETLSVGAAWADADHDGDLDLYVANYADLRGDQAGAPNRLYRNNGDGTFVDVAPLAGVDGGPTRSTGVLFLDVDDDRDLDLYLINDRAANRLFRNDRLGEYQEITDSHRSLADDGPGLGALAGDLNQDGLEDVLLLRGEEPPTLLLQVVGGRFQPDQAWASQMQEVAGTVGALIGDFDLDGDHDLVLIGAGRSGHNGHRLLVHQGEGRFSAPILLGEERDQPDARGAVAADLNGDGSLELIVGRAGSGPQVFGTEAGAAHWLELVPEGADRERKVGQAQSGALGLQVEIKTGRRLQVASLRSSSGYLGGPPAVLHFGLGASEKLDYVRLHWPDAVLQSEIEVAVDQRWKVRKVRRKPSSCPLLFTWDGERFAFVTDFLGVGGVGFLVAPGEYATPDPTEAVRIPPGQLVEQDGRYRLRVAEPLEEVTWLDELQLVAYDHPESVELFPDERFSGTAPFPTGEPVLVSEKLFPVAARDERGRDLRERLLAVDRQFADPPDDQRFIGYARDHWLELDFGDAFRRYTGDGRLVLCLHGWVEYTYSHVNYAAHQAGLHMRSPSLEVQAGNGVWRTVVEELGFPAGLPRMMTFDLTHVPLGANGKLRIRSNMEVFYDQAFLGVERPAEPSEQVRVHRLEPVTAELRPLGYPREYSPDGFDPTLYDYQRLDAGVPFRNLSGEFTRFGDVRETLLRADDLHCTLARGEEVALEFDATALPPLRDGWSRTFVLHSVGYCKDMDLYTAFPETVEPLPYRDMNNYPPEEPMPAETRERQNQWNTRRVSGR